MGILIDSSVFIAAERGRLSLTKQLTEQKDEPVALSALTADDLLIGATAITIDSQVATVSARDFQRIPGLRIQIWGT